MMKFRYYINVLIPIILGFLVFSSIAVLNEYTWDHSGTYTIRVKSEDEYGAQSGWSELFTIQISNEPPDKPSKPIGVNTGTAGVEYNYSMSTVDPDGDQIYYKIDWGDGNESGWLGLYNSNQVATYSHIWTYEGDYEIRVKAKDTEYEESEWSDPLIVIMPKVKNFNQIPKIFIWLVV